MNPHSFKGNGILNPARLPVPPLRHEQQPAYHTTEWILRKPPLPQDGEAGIIDLLRHYQTKFARRDKTRRGTSITLEWVMATDNRRKRSKKKSAAAPVKSVRRTRPPRRSEPAATEAGRTTAAEVSRLRQSELLYRELVQNANSAIIRWKGDGTIAFFNEYAESFFGYKAEEVVGKNVRLLVPPQESTGTDLTTLISDIVANPDKYVNNVNENVCRDGRRVWMAWTNKPIFDETGQVSEILAVGSDITARKQAEEALRDSEARLAFALETIYTGAWELDLVDQTAHRSLTHDRIFGYESLLPRWTFEMFLEHVLPEDREEVARKFRHAVQTKTDWAFECRILRVDGEVRWIWAAGRHQPDAAGEMRRLAGVVQDITARKQAEEALRDSERRAREQAEELAVLLEAVLQHRLTSSKPSSNMGWRL